jgi:hypothetical protein
MVHEVARYLKRRLSRLPKWPYLVGAVALVLVGQVVEARGGVEALTRFTDGVVADLGAMNPISVIPSYFDHLFACNYNAELAYEDCSNLRFLAPTRYVGALIETSGAVWADSDWAGRLLLPIAILIGFCFAVSCVVWLQGKISGRNAEANLLTFVVAAVLTPFFVSIAGGVLQIAAMVLFTLFGAAIGLVIALAGLFAVPLKIISIVKSVEETGHGLQSATKLVTSKTSPSVKPPVDPPKT